MKWLSFAVSCLLAVALLVGSPGCKGGSKKTAEGEGGKKLTVKAPADTSVKQGETTMINVDITREKFNDPVDLKFSGLPDGVIIMEKDLAISKQKEILKPMWANMAYKSETRTMIFACFSG